ncbi:hypothetical protein PybrP1_009254 [[Pythium] brassicae (nom. inval.)]|nr:hypothetical protein PybrP1_009254 [[Pythium] brassicae (nom. inval.)]
MTKTHFFTDEFPDRDYRPTTASEHPQTRLWPAYLPVDDDRLFIFERSKNAQLVVFTANYADRERRVLDPKWPLDINWQSFGWTSQPTSNATGVLERKMAWGYSHKLVDAGTGAAAGSDGGAQFHVSLNALPSRAALLYHAVADSKLVLQTTIADVASRLLKVFVCTAPSRAFVPKVLYVELYGTCVATGADTYERIAVSGS